MDPRHASFLQGIDDAVRNHARMAVRSFDRPPSIYAYEAAGWQEAGIRSSPERQPPHVGDFHCGYRFWPRVGGYREFNATVDTSEAWLNRAVNHEFVPDSSSDASGDAGKSDPVGARLMLAVSPDGATWTKTGMVIANHSSVPCLAVEENSDGEETLYLFFCTTRARASYLHAVDKASRLDANRPTPLAVAYTTNLEAWRYRLLGDRGYGFTYPNLSDPSYGFDYNMPLDDSYSANDPSVVRAEDGGGWLMYYTLHWGKPDDGGAVVLVATAERLDDLSWVTDTSAVPVLPTLSEVKAGANAEDPTAYLRLGLPPGYLLFAGGNKPGYSWRAGTDISGRDVSRVDETQLRCWDSALHRQQVILNNAIPESGSITGTGWVASVGADGGAKFISSVSVDNNGAILSGAFSLGDIFSTMKCNTLLTPESNETPDGIREAAVAQFRDCWVMVYASSIPEEDT